MTRRLVVKLTWGAEETERCNQAFTVAATAVASGVDVSMWLTGAGAWIATPGYAEKFALDLATPLAELRDTVISGGTLTVCSQCAARRDLTAAELLPGVRIAGAAAFTEEILQAEVQALVY